MCQVVSKLSVTVSESDQIQALNGTVRPLTLLPFEARKRPFGGGSFLYHRQTEKDKEGRKSRFPPGLLDTVALGTTISSCEQRACHLRGLLYSIHKYIDRAGRSIIR